MKEDHIKPPQKIIIISDVNSKAESVIPYGLNLAKYFRSKVDILHTIDSRSQKSIYSRYADSQSLSTAKKMSHKEIMQREMHIARMAIDKILSREASVLNYPLKINSVIEDKSIINGLNSLVNNSTKTLVLVNSEPDKSIFSSAKEIVETFKNSSLQMLIVPPGKRFIGFNKVLLVTNFNDYTGFDKSLNTDSFLTDFTPLIKAIDVAKPKMYSKKETKRKAWLQLAKKISFSDTINTNILTGYNYLDTVQDYLDNNKTDLVLYNIKQRSFFGNGQQSKVTEELIKNAHSPILC